MGKAYYNEIDPYAAQWLRNLIAANHIAPGDVDTRSIEDVTPDDLRSYTQCHFFAGVGVWSFALRNSGWSDDRPVWTGSCPCQPFSAAGKGNGDADERHLWPAWHHLIRERRPPGVFGEQVSAAIRHGWADLVRADLEAEGYAVGFSVFGAHSVGAPHIRQRLWFVAEAMADTDSVGLSPRAVLERGVSSEERPRQSDAGPSIAVRVADAGSQRLSERSSITRIPGQARSGNARTPIERDGATHGMAYAHTNGCGSLSERHLHDVEHHTESRSAVNGPWRDADWLYCRDGKWRPVEPGTFPLAHGITNRVGRLRAYGNAINSKDAEAVIRSYMEVAA